MARDYYRDPVSGNLIAKAVKVEDTLPIGFEGEIPDGTPIPEGWVEVDDPNEYSTDEIKIGTWIDGKPLYRKVYTGTISTEGTNYNYNDITGLSNTIDQIVGFGGYANNNQTGGNRISNSIPNMWINATYFPIEHRIRIYSYDKTWFAIGTSYYLVVEYTKTTD